MFCILASLGYNYWQVPNSGKTVFLIYAHEYKYHTAVFLITLMIVAHLVARPFDELTKAHRVIQWLEVGSVYVCWLTMHAGTVFFNQDKEGHNSNDSLTALSFYVVAGNLLFTLYLVAV